MLAGKTERVFPVAIIGLFATGAYLTSDLWTWDTRWIDVSIAGLIIIALQGPVIAGRRAKALERALQENGPGPLGESARRMIRDAALWIVTFANPGIVLGIMWNMTQKPGTAEAIAAVAVGTPLAPASRSRSRPSVPPRSGQSCIRRASPGTGVRETGDGGGISGPAPTPGRQPIAYRTEAKSDFFPPWKRNQLRATV